MSDEIARLGFAVNSQPLDDARAKLSGMTTEATKTGQAVDGLNQQLGKSGDQFAKVTNAQKSVISGLDQQIAKTQLTSAELRVYNWLLEAGATLESDSGKAIAQRALVLDQALSKTHASTVGTGALGDALALLFPTLVSTKRATEEAATAHGGLSSQ